MKKSIVAILLIALMLCVSGCGSSNTSDTTVAAGASDNENTTLNHTQTSTTGTAKRENGVYGKILVLGNIEFTIPEGFQATIIDENTYMLTSKDYACSIGLYANSVQELDEEMTQIYLPLQHQAFVGEEETKYEESKLDGFAAGFEIKMNSYASATDDLRLSINMNSTFTDSWYAYTVMFKCASDSANLNSYVTTFAEVTGYAEYVGDEPRFDFVQ